MAFSLLEKLESFDRPITQAEAVRISGLSRSTVYRMIQDQEIPTIDFGSIERKMIDPKTWAFVLKRRNPIMREAHRRG